MSNARLREALNAGGPGTGKDKGPPVADGVLSVTPDTPEASEWRTRQSAIDFPSSSSTYLEDDDDGSLAAKPADLYGKFTWKIENFSDISKRELRSNIFEVGSYKWYILVYPQGCDVCNHLSLFLCVADYDKLLPGWSHFAQFTIAVVNKDPKKSKYSDTLHRFCKKEHDWGWKKFMELSKVLDGFTVADTLVIKAQVQVIKDRVARPFRCLDPQYRRELVRVYLTNVEGICRRFVEERRERLSMVRENPQNFRAFWEELQKWQKERLAQEKCEVILKGVVKRFFNEKEVTSTLVMDALYSGCRAMEEHTRQWVEHSKTVGPSEPDNVVEQPSVLIHAERGIFALGDEVLNALERAANESIPPFRDDKCSDSLCGRNQGDEDYGKDSVDRDERRLAELGRRTVEMFVLSHVYTESLEVSYREAESLKRQEALIKEEEEQERLEDERTQARQAAEKERKNRKKERKAKAKAKKDAEDAERKRQEDEARAAQEAKARAAAEKRRMEDETRAAAERDQRAAEGKLRHDTVFGSPSTGKKNAASPVKSMPAVALRVEQTKDAGQTTDGQAVQDVEATESAQNQGEALSGDSSTPSNYRHGTSQSSNNHAQAQNSRPSDSSSLKDGITEQSGDGPSSAVSSGQTSDVEQLREQLRQMEQLLKERDAEIFALRMQLAELSVGKSESGSLSQGKSSSSIQRSNSGLHLENEQAPNTSAPLQTSRDSTHISGVDPTAAKSGRESGVAHTAVGGLQQSAGITSTPHHASASQSGAMEDSILSQGSEVRGSGRSAKRGVGGKHAMQAATAAAAAALNARQISGSVANSGAMSQQQPLAVTSRADTVSSQQSQLSPTSTAPQQPRRAGARQALNAPMPGSTAHHPGKTLGTSSSAHQSNKQPQSPLFPSTATHGNKVAANGQMLALSAANGLPGGGSIMNGVPSYRNAALGQTIEGQQTAGIVPPPPPPLQHAPGNVLPAKDTQHPADSTDSQYQRLLLSQQQNAASPLANHFGTPITKGSSMAGASSTESPGLDDFAHMGLITDLLE